MSEKAMENENKDDRYQNDNAPKGPSANTTPAPGTADNESVYGKPPIEKATDDGKSDKMQEGASEDRKHTP